MDARIQSRKVDAQTGNPQLLQDGRAPEAPALGPIEVEVRGEEKPPRVHVQGANLDVVEGRDIPQRHDGAHDDGLELIDEPTFIDAVDGHYGLTGDVRSPLAVATQGLDVQVQDAETLVLHCSAVECVPKVGEEPAADAPRQREGLHVCCDGAELFTETQFAHTVELIQTAQAVETEGEISHSRTHGRRDPEGSNHQLVDWEIEWPEGAVPGEEIGEGPSDSDVVLFSTSQVVRSARDERLDIRQLRQTPEPGVSPTTILAVMMDQLAIAAAATVQRHDVDVWKTELDQGEKALQRGECVTRHEPEIVCTSTEMNVVLISARQYSLENSFVPNGKDELNAADVRT